METQANEMKTAVVFTGGFCHTERLAGKLPAADFTVAADAGLKTARKLGVKPTVSGNGAPAAEVHLFGFDGDLYGRKVSVAFRKNIREERRFASVEALRAQIAEDVENVQQMFKE